jgi:predicted O-methyltransferase YrrM
MKTIQIGRERFSKFFWDIIDEKVGDVPWQEIEDMIADRQEYRRKAEYNTGSLSVDDAAELYRLVKFFKPSTIAEVGTFIGVSTMAMYMADKYVSIDTCDMSNDIPNLFEDTKGMVTYFPKTSSTEMFKKLAEEENPSIDLIYLDGRLSQPDIEPLSKIVCEKTVFVLDDFEGIEKGVANALMLEHPSRVLIYPRADNKTAVSMPVGLIQLVPQEAT